MAAGGEAMTAQTATRAAPRAQTPNPAPGAPSTARILGASLVGTAVEFYDFYIYATAASLVFPMLFFPKASASAQLMSSYATFAVAFFARPLGAAFFGHFGDRIGRKSTLVASLMTMGASTVLIGVLPTYVQIGWLAPALLSLMRFGQGFGLGGEWGGATLLAVENAPPGWRARFGMFPQLGAPVGFIAANGLFLLLDLFLTKAQFAAWGWRIPFILSSVLVLIGLWVRLKLTETPAFKAALAEAPPPAAPLGEVLFRHPLSTVAGTFAVVACFAIFYLTTAFSLGYGTKTLGYTTKAFLGAQLGGISFLAIGIIVAAWWSDHANPRRALMAGCLGVVGAGLLMPLMLQGGSLLIVWAFLSLAFFVMGFAYGPLGAFLPSLFPARVRYSGCSIAFNVGGILGGGLAPIIAAALAAEGGLLPVGLYLAGSAVISLVALLPLARRTGHGLA
jgi:MFS family permease